MSPRSSLEDLGYPVNRVNMATGRLRTPQGLYANRRAKIFFGGLRPRFKAGEIYSAVGWDDETIRQLSSLQWHIVPAGGMVAIESTVQAKARVVQVSTSLTRSHSRSSRQTGRWR